MAEGVNLLVDEYLELKLKRRAPVNVVDTGNGVIEFCGVGEAATLAWVLDDRLSLLNVGSREATVEFFERRQAERGERFAWAFQRPLAVQFQGRKFPFRPLGGGRAVGVAELDGAVVVLGVVGRTCVAVLIQGRRRSVCHSSPWHELGTVDLDVFLALDPPRAREREPRHHDEATAQRIRHGLRDLGQRALALRDGPKRRGRAAVVALVECLVWLVQVSAEDLRGRVAEVLAELRRCPSGATLDTRSVGSVLTLLVRTNTRLVERPTSRTWHVRLAELVVPSSAVHRDLCNSVPRRRLPPTAGDLMAGLTEPDDLVDRGPEDREQGGGQEGEGA